MRRQYVEELQKLAPAAGMYIHEYEYNQLIRLIEYLTTVDSPHGGAMTNSILQRDFKNFYEQYDQRRGKNFRDTFPQLAEWYDTL